MIFHGVQKFHLGRVRNQPGILPEMDHFLVTFSTFSDHFHENPVIYPFSAVLDLSAPRGAKTSWDSSRFYVEKVGKFMFFIGPKCGPMRDAESVKNGH